MKCLSFATLTMKISTWNIDLEYRLGISTWNIDLEYILALLNSFAREYGLESRDWKLPFRMQKSNSESGNYDYFKRVEFIVKK